MSFSFKNCPACNMMKIKHALVGGGTGFIGKRLTKALTDKGYDVTIISRMPGKRSITWHQLEESGIPKSVSCVVNLCGQNVLDPARRWTPGFQQNVYNSRINSSSALVKAIMRAEEQICVFVNISGCSSYFPSENTTYSEEDQVANFDFMSNLCIEWEKAATIPLGVQCRNVKIRTGVVIGKEGGMIGSIYLPFVMGVGGPLGDGSQPLPWIHIDDLCNLIIYSIEKPDVKGVLNGVAPELVTNAQFSKVINFVWNRKVISKLIYRPLQHL